jgi:hypothetical protein
MTLFYMSPDDDFPNPPKGSTPEEISHKKILDNWFAFTDSLEPEFSKLTFFPENILPHERSTYLQAFAKEYENRLKSGELSESILNSLAINVANVYRFSPLIYEGFHCLHTQKLLDNPSEAIKLDKSSSIDNDLIKGLVEGIHKFCESEGFPKKVMFESNAMFFIGFDKTNLDSLKSLFITEEKEKNRNPHQNISPRRDRGPNHLVWTVISILIALGGLYYIYAQALMRTTS